jgi:thiol:disulfide interchange protein
MTSELSRVRFPRRSWQCVVPRLSLALLALAGCPMGTSGGTDGDAGAVSLTTTATAATTAAPPAAAVPSGEGWNPAQIAWQPYEAGLRQAKDENKPVCLILSTTWCPHCKNFSHVFDDPRVVTSARSFVMVHLDADANEAIASRYVVDGSYIPRTFFLAPDGTLDGDIHAPRARSRFFYDERDPSSLLAAMDTAKKKLVN